MLVAGEVSGDLLGAALIRQLKKQYPGSQFEGIGGPAMLAEGFYSFVPMERLSVMGLVEVLGRLRELLGIRKSLVKHYQPDLPDAFIGIDAPDFNLELASQFKQMGTLAVHFVSPSVWAWRPERVDKIVKQIDLMLTLFPFEVPLYREKGLPVDCVGHPLADRIEHDPSKAEARAALGLDDLLTLAVLPGSRSGEVSRMGPVFAQVTQQLSRHFKDLQIVIPSATVALKSELLKHWSGQQVKIIEGTANTAMAACDAALLASGTAALECGLIGRPMAVAYKINALTYRWVRRKLNVDHVALPNHLMDRPRVPEFLQHECTPDNLVPALIELLSNHDPELQAEFKKMHQALATNAAQKAGQAISSMLSHRDAERA